MIFKKIINLLFCQPDVDRLLNPIQKITRYYHYFLPITIHYIRYIYKDVSYNSSSVQFQ